MASLPVKAIVYTRAHGDHTGGASAYEYASDKASVRIIGPEGMGDDTGGNADIRTLLMKRGQFQFGRGLPSSKLTNRALLLQIPTIKIAVKPNVLVDGVLETTIAGIKLHFEQAPGEKKPLLTGWTGANGCLATSRIMVEGCKVGYCYREKPDDDWDSGWRFTAGDESQPYMDDPNHSSLYVLNTVCNDDPDIKSPVRICFQS